jgi:hypothetical protein
MAATGTGLGEAAAAGRPKVAAAVAENELGAGTTDAAAACHHLFQMWCDESNACVGARGCTGLPVNCEACSLNQQGSCGRTVSQCDSRYHQHGCVAVLKFFDYPIFEIAKLLYFLRVFE